MKGKSEDKFAKILSEATVSKPNQFNKIIADFLAELEKNIYGPLTKEKYWESIALSPDLVEAFKVEPGCLRMIPEGGSIMYNLDRVNLYGMRYMCESCFVKEDNQDCNIGAIKCHGICKNIMRPSYLDKANQSRLMEEVAKDSCQAFSRTKEVLIDAFLAIFKGLKTGKYNDMLFADLFYNLFSELFEILVVSCRENVGLALSICRGFLDTNEEVKLELGFDNILQVLFFANSRSTFVSMHNFLNLAGYLTIFTDFNLSIMHCIMTNFEATFKSNGDNNKVTPFQTLLRLVTFDTAAMNLYIASPVGLTEFLKRMTDIVLKEINASAVADSRTHLDYLNYVFFQITMMIKFKETAQAFAECDLALQQFMELVLAFQYLDYLDNKKDMYLIKEIVAFDDILELEESVHLFFSDLLAHIPDRGIKEKFIYKTLRHIVRIEESYQAKVKISLRYSSYMTPLQRVFSLSVIALLTIEKEDSLQMGFYKDSLEKIMNNLFDSSKLKMQKFFGKLGKEVLHTVGFGYEIGRKMWARYGDEELHYIQEHYLHDYFMLYDCDIVFLKISLLFLSPPEFAELYTAFSSSLKFANLFEKDITKLKAYVQEDWFEKMFLLYKDFLGFLSFLVTDEISISNIMTYCVHKDVLDKFCKKKSGLPVFSQMIELAKTAVYCLGSCNTKKLNDLGYCFFPFSIPFPCIVMDHFEFDERTKILRLKQQDTDRFAEEGVNMNQFSRSMVATSEIYEMMEQKKLSPGFHVAKLPQVYHWINLEIATKLVEGKMLGEIFAVYADYEVDLEIAVQVLPLLVNLANIYVHALKSTGSTVVNDFQKNLLVKLFVHKWAKIDTGSSQLNQMLNKFHLKVNDMLEVNPVATLQVQKTDQSIDNSKEEKKKQMALKMQKMQEKFKKKQMDILGLETPESLKEITGEDQNQPKSYPERTRHLCSFCLSIVEEDAEQNLFTFLRFTKTKGSEVLFPLLSGCSHPIHRNCFSEMQKRQKHKKKHWFWQSECLQCKQLSNCLIAKKSTYIDVDYMKESFQEQKKNISREVDLSTFGELPNQLCLASMLVFFLHMIIVERANYTVGALMQHHLSCYRLVLEHVRNLDKLEPLVLAGRIQNAISKLDTKDSKMMAKLIQLLVFDKALEGRSDEEHYDLCFDAIKSSYDDLGVCRIASFLTLLVKRGLTKTIPEETWNLLTNPGQTQHESRKFYRQVVASQPPKEGIIQEKNEEDETTEIVAVKEQFQVLETRFVNLQNRVLKTKCGLCKHLPKGGSTELLLCLICGEIVCRKKCGDDFEDSDEEEEPTSNENRHALLLHQGASCFVSVYTGQLFLLEFPLSKQSVDSRRAKGLLLPRGLRVQSQPVPQAGRREDHLRVRQGGAVRPGGVGAPLSDGGHTHAYARG